MQSFMNQLLSGNSPRSGLWAAVVTVIIWTAFIIIARASAQHSLLPLDITWARIVGASVILLPWSWWTVRKQRRVQPHTGSFGGFSPLPWRITVVTGFFGGFAYAVLAYNGFFYAPAAHGSVLMPGSLPLWTSVLAVFLLGERLHGYRVIGLAMILTGDLLVGGSSLWHAFDGGTVWVGDLLFMAASACWSTYSVLSRRFQLQPVAATMAITCFAFFSFVPLYAFLCSVGVLTTHLWTAPWQEVLWQAMFQGGGSVVLSGISFTLMIRAYGPVRSTMLTALVPGLSALGAVIWLGEPLGWQILLGLSLVTLGIVFGVQPARSLPWKPAP
jgi:drug/metabolite transporter (DMT)-like permease